MPTYDFLGDAASISDDAYAKLMDFVKRVGKAWEALVDSTRLLVAAIRSQFDGLDLAGAAANSLVAFNHLLSNSMRQAVEVLGPLAVAFNIPETAAVALDGAAQLFLTLASGINFAGTAAKNFSDTALIPLVAWVGDKLRGAVETCISALSGWQQWFSKNAQGAAQLGTAAGNGAALVLKLAAAVGDGAFTVATAAFTALNSALQGVLGVLVNSGAARSAAAYLGAAMTALAVGNGTAKGLSAIGGAFASMASVIEGRSASAAAKAGLLSTSLGRNLSKGMGDAKAGAKLLGDALGLTAPKMDGLKSSLDKANDAAATAADRLKAERTALNGMREAAADGTANVSNLALSHQKVNVKLAETDMRLKQSKVSLAGAKVACQAYATSTDRTVAGLIRHKAAEMGVAAQVGKSTIAKAAAVTQTTALTAAAKLAAVAEGAMATASGVLAAAINAIPGMVLVTALGLILSNLDKAGEAMGTFIGWLRDACAPFNSLCDFVTDFATGLDDLTGGLLSTVGSAIGSLLGLSDANAKVSDSTEMANDAMEEERQRVEENMESIRQYRETHDNLSDALAVACGDETRFAQYLQSTGQTLDEAQQKQQGYVDGVINGFQRLDTSTQMSLADVNASLAANIATQQQWSDDLVTLMGQTGLDANSALIRNLQSAGPGKMAQALHEVVNNPGSEQAQQFLDNMKQAGLMTEPTFAAGMSEAGTEGVSAAAEGIADSANDGLADTEGAKESGKKVVDGYGDGIAEGATNAGSEAKAVREAAVRGFNGGTGYNEALSAGRNLTGGYGDGIKQAAGSATANAKSVRDQVVRGLNGGYGTSSARTAGSQTMGGYRDGLQSLASSAYNTAKSASSQVASALKSQAAAARSAGSATMGSFVSGLKSLVRSARSAGQDGAGSAKSGLGSASAYYEGRNLVQGYINGMGSKSGSVYAKAYEIARSAVDAVNDAQRSGSPSKLTYKSGVWWGEGYENGMVSMGARIASTAYSLVQDALDVSSMASYLGRVAGKAFSDGMGGSLDPSKAVSVMEAMERNARVSAPTWVPASKSSAPARHERTVATHDDYDAASIIAGAVSRGMLTVSGPSSGSGGDGDVVLRVDSEDLARAAMRGQRSLVRRGMVEFS